MPQQRTIVFDDEQPQAEQQPVQQPPQSQPVQKPSQFPGVIQGRPAPPDPITPYQEQQINLQEGREDRADRADQRGAVGEQQAYTLVSRVGGGIDDIRYVYETWPEAKDAPGLGDAILYGNFGPNSVVTRGLADEGRVALEDTQRDIIDALLTLGTGAAYTDEQLETYRASYFPQYNDSPEQMELKRRRLNRAFEEAIPRAGPLADRLQQYQTALLGDINATQGDDEQGITPQTADPINPTETRDMFPQGAETGFDRVGRDDPVDRYQMVVNAFGEDVARAEDRIVGFWNAQSGNRRLTPAMARRWYESNNLPIPTEEALAESVEKARSGERFVGFDMSDAEQARLDALDAEIERRGIDPEGQGQTGAQGFVSGATLGFSDEISGAVNAIPQVFQGVSIGDAYGANRDVERRINQRGREENPGTFLGSQIAGGLVTGGIRAAPQVLRSAAPVRAAAQEGAILGGIAGFGEGEGAANSALGAGFGAATGAAVGAGLTGGINALAPAVSRGRNALFGERPPLPDADEVRGVVQAGERQGVPVRRADVDPAVRTQRGQVQQTPQGRQALNSAMTDDIAAIEESLVRSLGGSTVNRTGAGEVIQGGVTSARERIRRQAGAEYRAASEEAGNVQVIPARALEAIDEQIADLTANGANANKAKIQYMRDLREDLSQGGGMRIDGLRSRRTNLRDDLNNASLYSSDFERRVNLALNAVSDDITRGLADNPTALARYQEADRLWRQQAEIGEQLGDALLGRNARNPKAPGQTASTIMNWANKDPRRLERLLNEVDDETRDEVRALVASEIGRKPNGEFQLGAFLTQTSEGRGGRLNPRSVRALFGEDGARAIRDLRALAQAKTDAASATNFSNTGSLVEKAKNNVRRMLLGGFGLTAVDGGAGAVAGAAAVATGELFQRLGTERAVRMLLNPNFTSWLRKLPSTNSPRAINNTFDRLRRTASRSPAMVADVQALERALIDAVNDNAVGAGRAVAEEEPQANEN